LNKKQDDREVNTTDLGDRKDRGDHRYRGNRQYQSSIHKENRHFHRPDDAEKWCEIHRTSGHDLEECKTFLDHKKMPPLATSVIKEPHRDKYPRANLTNDDEQMREINVIFRDSISITLKTQGKKLKREISLAQRIEPGRKMRWSDVDISFRAEDHPETELSDRNLSFMIKLLIGWYKVAKTLIDNGASLNLIIRKTFIEMGINLKDLTPIRDTFHKVITGQSSTPIGRIDLEVFCGTRDNKRKEMMMFVVASFDIGYTASLGGLSS
jgi:hypothetical protein